MKNRLPRALTIGLIMLSLLATRRATGNGESCYWIGANGNFDDSNQWVCNNGHRVPDSGDAAIFSLLGPSLGTVTFHGSNSLFVPAVFTNDTLSVYASAIMFSRGAGTFAPTYNVVNSISIDSLKLITGSFPVSGKTVAISAGELDITGSTFTVTSSSATQAALTVSAPSNGSGAVKITGGGKLELTGAIGNVAVGPDSGSTGEVDVDGAGSKLMVDGNASTITVGDNGTCILKITGGAVVDDNAALMGVHSSLGNSASVRSSRYEVPLANILQATEPSATAATCVADVGERTLDQLAPPPLQSLAIGPLSAGRLPSTAAFCSSVLSVQRRRPRGSGMYVFTPRRSNSWQARSVSAA